MSSVSGAASGLGNTALRGLGGMATGIDRDSIIEKMTAGTAAKITKLKNSVVSLNWKQEAYQSVSKMMLELQDNFFSFASGSNIKSAASFARNQITALGDPEITKFVSASGSSKMIDQLSIRGVKSLATKATRLSDVKGSPSPIETNITNDLSSTVYSTSRLKGTELKLGQYNGADGSFRPMGTFTFPATYKETVSKPDGTVEEVVREIDYTAEPEVLVAQLNKALESMDFKVGTDGRIKFDYNAGGDGRITIRATGSAADCVIRETSTALGALGFDLSRLGEEDRKDGISLDEFENPANKIEFKDACVANQNIVQYLTGKKLTVTIGGQTKEIELLKQGDPVSSFDGGRTQSADGTCSYDADSLAGLIQNRLDKAFGTGKVIVDTDGGSLSFKANQDKEGKVPDLTITSDDGELRKTMGIAKNASSNISLDSSLWENREKLGFTGYTDDEAGRTDFEENLRSSFIINGTKIEGLTAKTTVHELIDKINGTKDLGINAAYLKSENQFALMATESGSGRKIQLEGMAAQIFGTTDEAGNNRDGADAVIEVSYGSGINTTVTSSSNTFDFEGLKITVSNTFGYRLDSSGNSTGQLDPSQTVTFSAKADVDGVTDQVRKFIEDYNNLIKEINSQITTKPDKAYGPLTEQQKAEMSDKSIENWEAKAKQGLLYNDATMREVSMSVQNILTTLLGSGVSSKDLEDIGISVSDGWIEGGTISFDESRFKSAMTAEPDKVSDIFAGGGKVKKGLAAIVEETITPYATKYAGRNGNSYGRLIEEAGSLKVPSSVTNNQIYRQLQEMQKNVDMLNKQLRNEQDRYISKFTTMETLINQMNAQSSYLSSI